MDSTQYMILLVSLLGLAFLISFWLGYRRVLRLQHLNERAVLNGFIAAVLILTLMTGAELLGFFSERVAANFTMGLYTMVAGFFCGFALKMVLLRGDAKDIEYVYRSFWTDAAPNLIAVLLIAFGIYRTSVLTVGPFTGIGTTSGMSLIGFGLFGMTMRIVPEFRFRGILILDQFVPWQKVVAYSWHDENALTIEYLTPDSKLTEFTTFIPPDDQVLVERLLSQKLKEHEQERKNVIMEKEEM